MASARAINDFLSYKYDPADDSPTKFVENYDKIVSFRDNLKRKRDARERKREEMKKFSAPSTAPSTTQGSRFSGLSTEDDGSAIPPPTKHKFAAKFSTEKLLKLSNSERRDEVEKLKKDLQFLNEQKKEKRAVAVEKPSEVREQDEAGDESERDGSEEDVDGASSSKVGKDWNKVLGGEKRQMGA